MTTSDEYQAEIRMALGAAGTDTGLFPAAQTLWALNAGLRKIATEREWPWLFTLATSTTTADDSTLTLPSTVSRLVYVTVDGYDLEEASIRELAGYRTALDTTGLPGLYAVEGQTVRVAPAPDAVYDVEMGFYQHEPALAAGTGTPLIPDAYSDWVVVAGAARLAVRTNNLERLGALKDEYAKWLDIAKDNARRSAAVSRIRRTRPNVWPEGWA